MESRGAGRVRAWRGGARSFLHVNRDRVVGRAVVTRSLWCDASPRAWGLWELESHAVREREGEEKEEIQRTGEVGIQGSLKGKAPRGEDFPVIIYYFFDRIGSWVERGHTYQWVSLIGSTPRLQECLPRTYASTLVSSPQ
ncbi:hypothetical protein NDU88_000662 [Pleurodeles waltl]|uniref:Uncharacterized protein n=1 Tax=Pleurodeles waltl TaxID=8319 RepID=A0AAV7THE7_PLEWA|nr:hypothetical protein NDU88_000662 [Pleurodeles waltl]